MKKNSIGHFIRNSLLISALALSGCSTLTGLTQPKVTDEKTNFSLDGKWKFSIANKPEHTYQWQPIKVPANWYKDNYDLSGVAWYEKDFFVSETVQDKNLTLILNGVDYQYDVWLNDQHVKNHEGYFQRVAIDLTSAIRFGKSNKLTIRVDSPLEKEKDFSLRKRLIKGIFSHHDTRPGGAWSKDGQDKNTGGIWDSVELHTSQNLFIEKIKSIPYQKTQNHWILKNSLSLLGKVPEGTTFHWQLEGYNHSTPVLSGHSSKTEFDISINKPALWWPASHGKPNLYTLKIKAIHQDKTLHQKTIRTAFRKAEINENKIWSINGKRLLLKGTNYIPTQWLSELTTKDIEKDIKLMEEAHINTVRVHAHITHPDFYRLCDERGMLIWQDFPLQWGYQDTPEFHEQAHKQLEDMIVQLGNHPSIIHWTIHNEPPWDADWMKWIYPDYDPKQNKILDESLYKFALTKESSRPISMISATKEHPWLGWYSGSWLDYAKPTKEPFIAEFGSQSLPKMASLERVLGEEHLSIPDKHKEWKGWEKWKYHNFQPRETFEIAKIDYPKNVDDLIESTQSYQSQLIQLAAESYRRQAYQPVSSLFHFMFVEDWPSMNWGIVDYWRNTKPGYDALKLAYQPILPSMEWNQVEYPTGEVKIGLWALNDSINDYDSVTYEISLFKGKEKLDHANFTLKLPHDSHQRLKNYQTPILDEGHYTVKTTIKDETGNALGNNQYDFLVKNSKTKKETK